MSASEKRCSNCGQPGEFGRSKTSRDGLKSHCKKCCAAKQRGYAATHPEVWVNWATANAEHLKARDAARYAADPEAEKARVKVYKAANPEKRDLWQQRANLARYGITPEEKQAIFDRQGGLCPICSAALTTGRTGMQLDHDHASGAVRGLLCHLCNMMLGDFQEDPARLQAAVSYLNRGPVTGLSPVQRPPEAGKAGTRASNLWYQYGLTEQTYQELISRQGGACAICREDLVLAHIDHDHGLGRKGLRGILCRSCNLGLGHARDDARVLVGAAAYLV